MRGWAKHSIIKVYICEWKHLVTQAWRNKGEKNKNKHYFFCSHVLHKDTYCFGGKPQATQGTTSARRLIFICDVLETGRKTEKG